jgi:Ankyrin repeats (many copies)
MPTLSPQQYLDAMIRSRGYSAATYSTLSSAYHNKPTPYQLASYGVYVINLIRTSSIEGLHEVFDVGLSPNACNAHGESIVHNVCRRCDVQVLDVLLQAGCEIQISDDNGRTPLHDACWAPEPNFPLVERLLERDIRLLYMADSHGHLPLSYTRQDHWSEWLQFLQSKKDLYWPRNASSDCSAAPALTLLEPHSRPIPNPEESLSIQLALMVAGGKIKPKEASLLKLVEEESAPDDESDDDDYDDDDDDYSESSYDSDEDSESGYDCTEPETSLANDFESSWDVKEMKEVLESLNSPIKRPLVW